jgi:hypothetical protein
MKLPSCGNYLAAPPLRTEKKPVFSGLHVLIAVNHENQRVTSMCFAVI